MRLSGPPILVITDQSQCRDSLVSRAEALFEGGCRWLSLREKDLTADARAALLGRLIEIARPYGAVIGVHDDIPAASALGCALHLPADGGARAARQVLGDGAMIGQSCHSADEARTAAAAGVDYITLSPAFVSASKPGYGPAITLHQYRAAALAIPVLALGGVTETTLPMLAQSGVGGIAIMGAAMRTEDPAGWFRDLARQWKTLAIDVSTKA